VPPIQPANAPKTPTCPACDKPMRLVSAVPAMMYRNLKQAHFECDCGWKSDALIADKDE
jgi:hypothetical protein